MPAQTPLRRFAGPGQWFVPNVTSLAFDAPNGRLLVGTSRGFRALDLESGSEAFRSEGPDRTTAGDDLRICAAANRVVALSEQELVTWDATSGRIASRATVAVLGRLDSISDDARLAVISVAMPEAARPAALYPAIPSRHLVVDVATGRVLRELPQTLGPTNRETIVDDDGSVLVCGRDGRLTEYDATGRIVRDYPPLPIDVSPDEPFADEPPARIVHDILPLAGNAVLIRSGDSMVRDRVTGERLWEMGPSLLESILVSGDRKRIYRRTSHPQSMEVVHDALTGSQQLLSGYGVIEWNITAEHDGMIATADVSGNIRVHRPGTLRPLAIPLDRVASMPESIAISRDGETIVVGCYDCSVRILEEGRIKALPGHTGTGAASGFLEDGRMWTSSSDHHRVWSKTGRLEIEEAFLGSTYANPQSSRAGRFLYGVRDASVTVRSASTGRLHRDRVLGVVNLREGGALLDDGVTYFSLTEQSIARWNLETGERTAEIPADRFDPDAFRQLAVAPDPSGKSVFLTGARITYLWEPDSGALRTIPQLLRVTQARFHGTVALMIGEHEGDPSDSLVGTRIHVLDLARLERIDVLAGLAEPIRAFHASGDFVAAISEDRTIAVWRYAAGG